MFLAPPAAAIDWTTETIDSTGDVGYYTSLALDDSGHAHISYMDFTNYHLKYATGTNGTWIVETLDVRYGTGEYSSLELDASAQPFISYYNVNQGNLSFASRTENEWTIVTIDRGGVGRHTSLVVDSSGNPRIGYQDLSNMKLKYAERNISLLWTNVTVDSGNVGAYASLALDSAENPHISYYDAGHGFLKYASRSAGLWSTVAVDTTGNAGYYTSVALDETGNPRISYYDRISRDLKFASKTGSVWRRETVDSTGDVGLYTSLSMDASGNPHISYYDATNGHLKYARRTGSVWTTENVDTGLNVGLYTSLALDGTGNPRISYRDGGNGDLKYATTIPPLIPDFTASSRNGTAPLDVQFSDTSTGGLPSCWNWSFGDGAWFNTSSAAERDPAHVYESPGTYDVTLIVQNLSIAVVLSNPGYITVVPLPVTTVPTPSTTPTPFETPTPLPTSPDPTPAQTPTPNLTSSFTPTPSPSATPEPSSSLTPEPASSPTPESTISSSPTLSTIAILDSGSEDPPDMPPVHRDPGSPGYKTGNFSGDSEVNLVRIIGWDTDCVVAAQQVAFLPDNLSPPPGVVYQYINVTPSRCPVVAGVLEFDVPPSFIKENLATPDDVKLCLVRNLSWICLITNAQEMKNDFVRYHAICPEFSLFVVTLSNETQGVPGGVVFTTQPVAPEYAPSDPAIPVISRSALSAAATDPDEGNAVVPVGIVAMGLCVLAIAVIVIFSTGNWR